MKIIRTPYNAQVSTFIEDYGKDRNITGTCMFDTVITKGIRKHTRFVEVTYRAGEIQSKRYGTVDNETYRKANRAVLEDRDVTRLHPVEIQFLSDNQ